MRRPDTHMRSFGTAVFAGALLVAECACAESPGTPSPADGNLVPNGSFEQNGQPTLETWEVANPAAASLVAQPAPGGGGWSLRLEADQAPATSQVRFRVPGLADGDVVRLSAQLQASGANGGGLVGLEITADDGHVRQKSYAASDAAQWTPVEVTFTIALQPGDSVWVVLKAPPTELIARAGLFDLVTLQRVGRS